MDVEKRYAGRGHPADHWHIDSPKDRHKHLDILLFDSGEYAVWSPETETCVSFHQSYEQAKNEVDRSWE